MTEATPNAARNHGDRDSSASHSQAQELRVRTPRTEGVTTTRRKPVKRPDVDQARLLPRYRPTPVRIVQPDNAMNHTPTFNAPGTPRARSNDGLMVDPRDLRGIPIVGRHVGGTSPGTDPLQAAINHLTRSERSAA